MADREQAGKAFGYRVAGRRSELGMSQEKLAELCDLSVNTIAKIESGRNDPKASTVMSLCAALGVSSDYLLYGSNLPKESSAADQLLGLFREAQAMLDDQKMNIVIQQAQLLVNNLASRGKT